MPAPRPLTLFNTLITVPRNTAKATGFQWCVAGQKAAKTDTFLALARWVKNASISALDYANSDTMGMTTDVLGVVRVGEL